MNAVRLTTALALLGTSTAGMASVANAAAYAVTVPGTGVTRPCELSFTANVDLNATVPVHFVSSTTCTA